MDGKVSTKRIKKGEVIQNTDSLIRKCGVCGWTWKKRMGAEDPRRCPNEGCRSVAWREPAGEGVAEGYGQPAAEATGEGAEKNRGRVPAAEGLIERATVSRENPMTGKEVRVPEGPAENVSVLEHAVRAEPGFGGSVTEHLLKSGVGGKVSEEPTDEIDFTEEVRPWLPELKKIEGREDAAELFADLLNGRAVRMPKGWMQMTLQQRAAWLDKNHPLRAK